MNHDDVYSRIVHKLGYDPQKEGTYTPTGIYAPKPADVVIEGEFEDEEPVEAAPAESSGLSVGTGLAVGLGLLALSVFVQKKAST